MGVSHFAGLACFSICANFSHIKERALKEPDTSEELMDMMAFITEARNAGMVKLNEQIKESHNRMHYLLDVYMFPQGDLDLNSEVLLWPQRINPVFDDNEEVPD